MDFITDPSGWWIEPFTENVFMQRALLAGLLAVLCTSAVGTWVVLRGLTFFGDALAHGLLPGIAVATIVGTSTTLGGLVAAVVMVGGISLVRANSPLPEDATIGLLFVGMLALAVVILSADSAAYSGDLSRLLFGSVTGVTDRDLLGQAVAVVVTLAGLALLHRGLLALTFDETQARLLGLRPRLVHVALLALVAVAIVASFRTVGNLLVFAMLVAPPATASLVARRVLPIMVTAVAFGWTAVVVGILVSYHHGTATGATIALTATGVFFGVLAAASLRQHLPRRYGSGEVRAGAGEA